MLQDILGCINSYKGDIKYSDALVHPGQFIVDQLGSENSQTNALNATSLQTWYEDYAKKRAAMGVHVNFKEVSSIATACAPGQKPVTFRLNHVTCCDFSQAIDSSMHGDVIKVPIIALMHLVRKTIGKQTQNFLIEATST